MPNRLFQHDDLSRRGRRPGDSSPNGSSVVITQKTAQKLFGNEDPMGKVLVHDNTHTLKVGGRHP